MISIALQAAFRPASRFRGRASLLSPRPPPEKSVSSFPYQNRVYLPFTNDFCCIRGCYFFSSFAASSATCE
jgi:hypothetical protein